MSDKWAIVKVLCTDGKERVGIIQQEGEELTPDRIIDKDLHEEVAHAMISYHAKKLNLEKFDNNCDYFPIEY